MDEDDMRRLAAWMIATLRAPDDKVAIERRHRDVTALCRAHRVPGIG
jgi:glycine/serine hydroxymethyltransferase